MFIEISSMPYLFVFRRTVYKSVMQDTDYMEKIYESTDEAGFRVVTWYNAGTRNFYGKKPINTPDDLKGMKIRVQQSPASVAMVNAFGAGTAVFMVEGLQLIIAILLMVLGVIIVYTSGKELFNKKAEVKHSKEGKLA